MTDLPIEAANGAAQARTRAPREAVAAMRIHAPTERNPRLAAFLAAANASMALEGALARRRRSTPSGWT